MAASWRKAIQSQQKAALPLVKYLKLAFVSNDLTPTGEIVPTQPAARLKAAIARGLFTSTLPV